MTIIWTNLSITSCTQFHCSQLLRSGEADFAMVFTINGHWGNLGRWTKTMNEFILPFSINGSGDSCLKSTQHLQKRERMDVQSILWSISMKVMSSGWVLSFGPLDLQSGELPTALWNMVCMGTVVMDWNHLKKLVPLTPRGNCMQYDNWPKHLGGEVVWNCWSLDENRQWTLSIH